MCHYKHLTPNERDLILKFLTLDDSISKIAKELNHNKSTISREIHRNSIDGEYLPSQAQEQIILGERIAGGTGLIESV